MSAYIRRISAMKYDDFQNDIFARIDRNEAKTKWYKKNLIVYVAAILLQKCQNRLDRTGSHQPDAATIGPISSFGPVWHIK